MSMEQLLERFKAAGSAVSRKTSCYRGVSWKEAAGKWRARIGGHNRDLGMFTSEEAAAQAYDYAALAKHGKYVWNTPMLPSAVRGLVSSCYTYLYPCKIRQLVGEGMQ